MSLDKRKVILYKDGKTIDYLFKDLKKDDIFSLLETENILVATEDGANSFIAKSDAYFNTAGIGQIDCEPYED